MALNSISSRAASVLPLIGIGLALANWNARPAAARAWAIAIVLFFVMIAVRYGWRLALRRSTRNNGAKHGVVIHAALTRTLTDVNRGVVLGALMVVIPLAVKLAHSYGLVGDPHSGRWTAMTMVSLGAYLAVLGNEMPRQLPPLSSMQGDGARIQAFQRRTGWTWVLCGVGFAIAWLALPISEARPVSIALVAAATLVTIVQLLRLRKVRVHAPGLH